MLDTLTFQLQKPQVWVGLALTLTVAYALYRFGRILLRHLEPHINRSLRTALQWIWRLLVIIGWLAIATNVVYLPDVPLLFELGQDIQSWFRHSAGQTLVILALALIAWNLVGALSGRIVQGSDDEFNRRTVRVQTLKGVVDSTLKVVIVIVGLIAGLQSLGVNATSLLAGVSVLGIAVGFGAQSLVKDVFTGFFILLEDQYGVGDVITVNTGLLSGSVEKLNLRMTALRGLDGTVHIIPNGQIATVSVSSKDWSRVVATVDVTYHANINDALRVLKAVSQELATDDEWKGYFLEEPDIQGVTQLTPDGVTLRALFKVQPKSQYAVGREFNRRIKIAMDQAGIEIPFPQRSLNFAGGPIEIKLTRDDQPRETQPSVQTPPSAPAPGLISTTPTPLTEQERTQAPVKPSLTRDAEDDKS
ncbi:mechanosensitive ion channel family protein [Deinococcus deserti]|uniref:Putative mscS mechanosensitive ion channel putative membrane protein n=1 Tax=Deinococcus deserti (strain DSM 17065 / CIP 109153 / LMG 22923 / VCD115) TaxID=546414 RepID=C1CXC7_DEIDV|nr:mechanosensitive ion channel family protein [Deinococcus deserti]ACO46844.1 putative mscS mechanosensitive ion channel; putative membrane protein [Deinococcus deserti VCD115]